MSESSPPIAFVCQECGAAWQAKSEFAGRRCKCGRCGAAIVLPMIPVVPILATLVDEPVGHFVATIVDETAIRPEGPTLPKEHDASGREIDIRRRPDKSPTVAGWCSRTYHQLATFISTFNDNRQRERRRREAEEAEQERRRWAAFHCPVCGSQERPCRDSESGGFGLALLLTLLCFWPLIFLLPFLKSKEFYRCTACRSKIGEL